MRSVGDKKKNIKHELWIKTFFCIKTGLCLGEAPGIDLSWLTRKSSPFLHKKLYAGFHRFKALGSKHFAWSTAVKEMSYFEEMIVGLGTWD